MTGFRRPPGLALALMACVACAVAPARAPPPAAVDFGEPEVVEAAPDLDRVPPEAALEEAARLEQRGDRGGARRLLGKVASREDLSPALRVRALVEGGVLALDGGDLGDALLAFREASAVVDARPPGELPPALTAHARFYLGEALAARSAAEPLEVESGDDRLEAALEARSRGLLEAQAAYLAAGREGDPEVAVAAGERVGALYERFREDLLAAPLPSRLTTAEARASYRAALRARVRLLAEQAETAWAATLEEARRRGIASDWIPRLEAALAQVRTALAEEGR